MLSRSIPTTGRTHPAPPTRSPSHALGVLVSLLAAGLIAVLILVLFGTDQGWEFAPDTFAKRSFLCLRIPLIDLQVGPTFRGSIIDPWDGDFLTRHWLVAADKKHPSTWHVIRPNRPGASPVCDPSILSDYLESINDGSVPSWRVWSKSHVPLAKVLWPVVSSAARHELYYVIPDLLDAANQADDPSELEKALGAILEEELRGRAPRPQPPP